MRTLLLALFAAGLLALASGCSTPAYSCGLPNAEFPDEKCTGENANNVVRGWYVDSQEMTDDINSTLLLGKPSQLTPWNVRD